MVANVEGKVSWLPNKSYTVINLNNFRYEKRNFKT